MLHKIKKLLFPEVYAFIGKAVFSINQVFPEGLPKDLPNSNQKLLEKILRISDKSLFRDDISIEKAQNIALWTIREPKHTSKYHKHSSHNSSPTSLICEIAEWNNKHGSYIPSYLIDFLPFFFINHNAQLVIL